MYATNSQKLKAKINTDTPVQYLKGVGPRLGALLKSRGLETVGDLLEYYPRDYQDRSSRVLVSELKPETTALLRGRIISFRYLPIRRLKKPLLEAVFEDDTGRLLLKWFHYQKGFFEAKFKDHPEVSLYGAPRHYQGRLEILHPELEFLTQEPNLDSSEEDEAPGLMPIYVEPEGLTQRVLRKIMAQALEALSDVPDDLPVKVRTQYGLMPRPQAISYVHKPVERTAEHVQLLRDFKSPAQQRLIFDDFFKFEWVIGQKRLTIRREVTKPYPKAPGLALLESFNKRLPFALTQDQVQANERIFEDLADTKPMNRLLQGDVGCGKTVVSLMASLPVSASGGQTALMVPTEILAQQHYQTACKLLQGLVLPHGKPIEVALLVGSTTKAARAAIIEGLKSGQINLIVGTHALLEPVVEFKELGLVIIDEQHRFGVDQRMTLRNKGRAPHLLSCTATPIPRTLALTAYGDLDVTTIKQLPKGRPEIHTRVVKQDRRDEMYDLITKQLQQKRQTYVIYPLVEESEKMDLANAIQGAEDLANGPLRGFKIGLLHGRMKANEKNQIMDKFKAGEIDVLVSTTVIEVGVDVPNATVLVIENAERFGLSQLHQLRGRVGRGTAESWCFLAPSKSGTSDVAYERLKAMEDTRDGFRLAELDLKIRGPGQFIGTKQSGELQFPYADLIRDQDILLKARQAAFEILKQDPELKSPENEPLKRYMNQRGALDKARFDTA